MGEEKAVCMCLRACCMQLLELRGQRSIRTAVALGSLQPRRSSRCMQHKYKEWGVCLKMTVPGNVIYADNIDTADLLCVL